MKPRNAHIILPLLALLLAGGCAKTVEGEHPSGVHSPVLLDIGVSSADISPSATRGAADAASDNEKMQKLRIIVVRPDGTVEHNRRVDLETAAVREEERFKVVPNEWKTIYLIVNEGLTTTRNGGSPDGSAGNPWPSFDFGGIHEGSVFPKEKAAGLMFRLSSKTEELDGPLPMSERHRVWMPDEDHACDLFVTRAAVKLSFSIVNESGKGLTLDSLFINRMLEREYLLPKNAVYGAPDADGSREIISFDVPSAGANDHYYTFGKSFGAGLGLTDGGTVTLEPIYLFEGKYSDPAGSASEKNYSMGISIREFGQAQPPKEYFPELPQLPRNTHVVVNVTIRGESEVNWTVDVVPYEETILDPDFGLDKLGIINY